MEEITETKKVTCTVCPRGCQMTVTRKGEDVTVEGATCARGRAYGREEILDPKRMITTTVRVSPLIAEDFLLPVRSASPVPKKLLLAIAEECRGITLDHTVRIGDVVIENVLGCGVDMVATADVPEK